MTSTPETTTQQADPAVEEASAAAADSASDVSAALDRGREAAQRVGEAAHQVGEKVGEAVSNLVTRLRNTAELEDDDPRGKTSIDNEVVEKIAGIAAREVPGVHDLGGQASRMFKSLREKIGLGESENEEADNGVSVRLEGSVGTVDLKIVIEFGYVVHSVTDAVRTKVISSVENMLGLEVTEVNIRVTDVNVPENHDQAA
jgi:uncharacterized alkaline shock family protein YloU